MIKLDVKMAALLQILLTAIQYLVPAFLVFNEEKRLAIAGFVSSVQLTLGLSAYYQLPNGNSILDHDIKPKTTAEARIDIEPPK